MKTISLAEDAYDRLRQARRHPRESLSSVVRRGRWPESKHTAVDLLDYMTRRAQAGTLLGEATFDRLETSLTHPRRSASRWGKA